MNQRTVIIVIVAAVLVALLFMFDNPFTSRQPSRKPGEDIVQLVVPMNEDEISRIEITTGMGTNSPIPGTSVTLTRKGREWFAGRYKADPAAVSQLIAGLQEIEDPKLISINPDSHMRFQVHAIIGKRIRVFDMAGELKTDVIVGQVEGAFFSVALRSPDSDNVYQARSSLRGVLMRTSWRDNNILRLQTDQVRSISVRRPEESYTLVRNAPDNWAFSDPTSAPADSQQVKLLLTRLSNLASTDFVEPTDDADALTSYGLADPPAELTVSLDDGSSLTVLFGNEDLVGARPLYYAKRADSPQIYKIAEYIYTGVIRESITLKPPAPPIPTPKPLPPDATTATATTADTEAPAAPTSPSLKTPPPPPPTEISPPIPATPPKTTTRTPPTTLDRTTPTAVIDLPTTPTP